ncbi:hypothetical protein N2152v2_007588 [Parachlorella kessleri]
MQLFHVACPFTGRAVCQCSHGTPASLRSPAAAASYREQALAAWNLWQDPGKALGRDDLIEVLLPRLVKVEKVIRKPNGIYADRGLPNRRDAERALHAATRAAEQSALRAYKLAAAAGLDYSPPEGLSMELPILEKADFSDLESAVDAALSARNWPASEAQQPAAAAAAVTAGLPAAAGPSSEGNQVPALSRGSPGLFSAGAQQAQQADGAGEGRGGSRQAAAARATAAAAAAAAHGGAQASPPDLLQASKPLRVRVRGSGKQPGKQGSHAAVAPTAAPVQVDMSAFPEGYTLRGPSTKHPPKSWCLKMKDYKASLAGQMVQLYWPDDGQWWPALVTAVTGSATDRRVSLYYETGDEELTDLTPLIKAGEAAWLFGPGGSGKLAAAGQAASDETHGGSLGRATTGGTSGGKRAAGRDGGAADGGGESTEDDEDPVLLRLRHVTKRQRQAAAAASRRSTGGGGAANGGMAGATSSASGGGDGGVAGVPQAVPGFLQQQQQHHQHQHQQQQQFGGMLGHEELFQYHQQQQYQQQPQQQHRQQQQYMQGGAMLSGFQQQQQAQQQYQQQPQQQALQQYHQPQQQAQQQYQQPQQQAQQQYQPPPQQAQQLLSMGMASGMAQEDPVTGQAAYAMAPQPNGLGVGAGAGGSTSLGTSQLGFGGGSLQPSQQQHQPWQQQQQQFQVGSGPALGPAPTSSMRELLQLGSAALGRTVQLRLGNIQPFHAVVADVLPATQQVKVQIGSRFAMLNAHDEGAKFLVHLT